MVLFQKCVRRFGPSTKMAPTAELSLTQDPMGNSHKNHLVWNQQPNQNQTLMEQSLNGPLPKLCPAVAVSYQDSCHSAVALLWKAALIQVSDYRLLGASGFSSACFLCTQCCQLAQCLWIGHHCFCLQPVSCIPNVASQQSVSGLVITVFVFSLCLVYPVLPASTVSLDCSSLFFVFSLCLVYPMLPASTVSLDSSSLISPLVFSMS